MRRIFASVLAVAFVSTPAHSTAWHDQTADIRSGAFIGARIQMPLRGNSGARPSAALTLAPTQSRISNSGLVRTRIGEGAAFNLATGAKPTVTLAGVRADQALGLRSAGEVNADRKLGMSTGAAIAIGVGVVAVLVVGGGLIYLSNYCGECD